MSAEPVEVPDEVQEQVKAALDTALTQPVAAQGFLTNIPNIDVGGAKDKVLGVLDAVLGAVNTALQYKWIIPDQYEAPLEKLAQALTKVKGWLD